MEKGKLIFLDIDGTLLGKGGRLPNSAENAVRRAKEQGHLIFIASGRSKCEIPKSLLELEFEGIIGAEGTYVEYKNEGIFHQPIQKEKLHPLLDYIDKHNGAVVLETNEKCYASESSYQKFLESVNLKEKWDKEVLDEFLGVFEVCKDPKKAENVNKIMYYDVTCSYEELNKEFGNDFRAIPNSIVAGDDKHCGEMSEKGMNKAQGMKVILKKLGRRREDTLAFGDGWNDLEMIRYAGMGIAMGNAIPELKEVADGIAKGVNEDGLYLAFQEFGLM